MANELAQLELALGLWDVPWKYGDGKNDGENLKGCDFCDYFMKKCEWKFWIGWVKYFRCCSSGDGGNSIVKALLCIETAFGVCLLFTDSDVPKDKGILNYEMHLHLQVGHVYPPLRIYMHLHLHIMSISKSIPSGNLT